jgi:hypothetical protein
VEQTLLDRTVWLALAVAALVITACGAPARYRNVINPDSSPLDLERDTRACEAEPIRRMGVSVTGLSVITEPAVDSRNLQRCLAARGWRRIDR